MFNVGYRPEDYPDIQRMPVPDNFSYVVPVDHIEHTDQTPFCWDAGCDCHEDELAIVQVDRAIQDGLITPEEATDFVSGRKI